MMNEREILFRPAFHKCHDQPSKDYGIGGVVMTWILRLDGKAIAWRLLTDWGLPDEAFKAANPGCSHPMHVNGYPSAGRATPGPIEWHRPPADASESSSPCELIGGPCYTRDPWYGGGDILFDLLRTEGGEAVWAKLRELSAGES